MKEDSDKNNKLSFIFYSVLIPILVIIVIVLSINLNADNEKYSNNVNNSKSEKNETLPSYIIKSDTTTVGYTFNISIDKFVEKYNEIKNTTDMLEYLSNINISDFKEVGSETTNNGSTLKTYIYEFSLPYSNTQQVFAIKIDKYNNICSMGYLSNREIKATLTLPKVMLMIMCDITENEAENIINKSIDNIGKSNYDKNLGICFSSYKDDTYNHFELFPSIVE